MIYYRSRQLHSSYSLCSFICRNTEISLNNNIHVKENIPNANHEYIHHINIVERVFNHIVAFLILLKNGSKTNRSQIDNIKFQGNIKNNNITKK